MLSIPNRRGLFRRSSAGALVLVLLQLAGCAFAPGMRYGAKAPSNGQSDTSANFNGITIELKALTPHEAWLSQRSEAFRSSADFPPELLQYRPHPYRLGKYDVLTIAIWEHPELTLPLGEYRSDNAAGQTLDDSGQFFFPYAGTVHAEGRTPNELRGMLRESLSKVLNNPQLDVKVTGYRSQRVFVQGAVPKPGQVPLTDLPLNLLDAINQAGGIQANSDPARVQLQRGSKTYVLDVDAVGPDGSNASRIYLQDKDVIRVPLATENNVYVLGEIPRPSSLPLVAGHLSLVNALATAGGLDPLSAQSKGIYVIRGEDSTRIQVWHLNARNPLALAMADRFWLRPRDVVFVDATDLASWNRVVNLVLPTMDLFFQGTNGASNIRNTIR